MLASQENLHRTHLSAPLWTQINSKMKQITWSKPFYYTAKVKKKDVSDRGKHSSYNQTQSNITSWAGKPALRGPGVEELQNSTSSLRFKQKEIKLWPALICSCLPQFGLNYSDSSVMAQTSEDGQCCELADKKHLMKFMEILPQCGSLCEW